MIRRYKPESLSGIPLLAASFLFAAISPVCAQQQSASGIFSPQKVVYTQQENQEVRDVVDKRLPKMERQLNEIEQKLNQLATAQTASIPPVTVGTAATAQPAAQTSLPGAMAPATQTPAQPQEKAANQATVSDALLEELYGEDDQAAIPAELQSLLSFDPSEVSLEGATFVGCVNDQAMFRGSNNKPFFVPATYALNHEAVRLIGGCSQ